MLIGRKREIETLNRLYNSGMFEIAIVSGRRGVGKTALLSEFIRGKTAMYFAALEEGMHGNLASLSHVLRKSRDGEISFPDYASAFDYAAGLSRTGRVAFIIDDCHFCADAFKGFLTLVRYMIETRFKFSKLFLILATSSSSFITEQIDASDSPLANLKMERINLEPLSFFEARRMCEGFSVDDAALLYGVTGGMPRYLSLMSASMPARDNVMLNFFDPSSSMFEEPLRLMRQEAREPSYYNAIMRAVAEGKVRNSEISTAVGLQTSACTAYLNRLIALGVLRRELPFGETSAKKTAYSIADSMLRFWYTFIPGIYSLIQSGDIAAAWEKVQSRLEGYMKTVFTEICRQWLIRESTEGRLGLYFWEQGRGAGGAPRSNEIDSLRRWLKREASAEEVHLELDSIGRWWSEKRTRSHGEGQAEVATVDITASAGDGGHLLCGCYWETSPVGVGELSRLRDSAAEMKLEKVQLFLFSRLGFTGELMEQSASEGGITLISLEDISM